ncbi:MAG: hypothetical protein KGK18_09220, partial [Burkholderiales bacterium]|nr:hypothetical protein [Burkholderiales bacterium]
SLTVVASAMGAGAAAGATAAGCEAAEAASCAWTSTGAVMKLAARAIAAKADCDRLINERVVILKTPGKDG